MGYQGLISKKLLVSVSWLNQLTIFHKARISILILTISSTSSRSNIQSHISTKLRISFSWSSLKDILSCWQLHEFANKIHQKPEFKISISRKQTPPSCHNSLHFTLLKKEFSALSALPAARSQMVSIITFADLHKQLESPCDQPLLVHSQLSRLSRETKELQAPHQCGWLRLRAK